MLVRQFLRLSKNIATTASEQASFRASKDSEKRAGLGFLFGVGSGLTAGFAQGVYDEVSHRRDPEAFTKDHGGYRKPNFSETVVKGLVYGLMGGVALGGSLGAPRVAAGVVAVTTAAAGLAVVNMPIKPKKP